MAETTTATVPGIGLAFDLFGDDPQALDACNRGAPNFITMRAINQTSSLSPLPSGPGQRHLIESPEPVTPYRWMGSYKTALRRPYPENRQGQLGAGR